MTVTNPYANVKIAEQPYGEWKVECVICGKADTSTPVIQAYNTILAHIVGTH